MANSKRARRSTIQRILAPIERFLAIESASGIVLMLAAAAALVCSNSPFRNVYTDLWRIPIGLGFRGFFFTQDLHFWINEVLMTFFFLLVGLEVRREMHFGELQDSRQAALPVAAAIGGMIVPGLIFFALNFHRPSVTGWAVPMATDIAFAAGALALLGKTVSPAVRILLLALAIIDDIGAIVVIALFYSTSLTAIGFPIAALGILATFACSGQVFDHSQPTSLLQR
jgi:NhaA family Na+:H+ antiporter